MRSPEAIETACLSVVPEFNSADPAGEIGDTSSFGTGFEADVEQTALASTSSGLRLRGPTGWFKAVDGEDLALASEDTGWQLSRSGSVFKLEGEGARYSLETPGANGEARPSTCVDSAPGTTTELSFDGQGIDQLTTDETSLGIDRDSSGRITQINGSLFGATHVTYDSGRLSKFELGEDAGSVDIGWAVVAGRTVPVELTYASRETVLVTYDPADATRATDIEVRDADDVVVDSAHFSGAGDARQLVTGDLTLPAGGLMASGRATGADSDPPALESTPDRGEFGYPQVYYADGGDSMYAEGEAVDVGSGIRQVQLLGGNDEVVASKTFSCSELLGCPVAVGLEALNVVGQPGVSGYLTMRVVDGLGNSSRTTVKEVDAFDVPSIEEPRIVTVAGGQVEFEWNAPWGTEIPIARKTRSRVNGGSWGSWESDDRGGISVAATVGDTVDLEFAAENAVGASAAQHTESFTVPSEGEGDPALPESDVPVAYQGDPTHAVTVNIHFALPGADIPAAGITGVFRAIATAPAGAGFDDIQHTGYAQADANGVMTIPGPIDADLWLTLNGVDQYNLGSSTESRTVDIELPLGDSAGTGGLGRSSGSGSGQGSHIPFGHPNPQEAAWCSATYHPARAVLCGISFVDAYEAQRVAKASWGGFPEDSGTRNAQQHAFWNASLASDTVNQPNPAWSMNDVRKLMNLHEYYTRNGTWEERQTSVMDFWNNHIGRVMGEERSDYSSRELCHAVRAKSLHATLGIFDGRTTSFVPYFGRYADRLIFIKFGNWYRGSGSGSCDTLSNVSTASGTGGYVLRYYASSVITSP